MKAVVIADTHLTHEYHKYFDKIAEFKKIIDHIMQVEKPDLFLVLGDFFDKKSTNQGRPISHIQGAQNQIPTIKIINKTKIPWYIIEGNHDNREVLKSFDQASKYIHFCDTNLEKINEEIGLLTEKPIEIDNILIWCSGISDNSLQRVKKEKLQAFCRAVSKFDTKKKNLLLTHLGFIRYDETKGLSKEIVEIMSNSFDLVLNGHEHFFATNTDKCKNVIQVPALMPWWITIKNAPIQKYKFLKDNILKKDGKPRKPFGYLTLDLQNLDFEFKSINTSMPIIKVIYNISNKKLPDIHDDWTNIVEKIRKLHIGINQQTNLIIIPVFTGEMKNIMSFAINDVLHNISNEFSNVFIENFRNDKNLTTEELSMDKLASTIVFTWDSVVANVKKDIPSIVKRLKEKEIYVSQDQIISFIEFMEKNEMEQFKIKENTSYWKFFSEIYERLLPLLNEITNMPIEEDKIHSLLRTVGGKK